MLVPWTPLSPSRRERGLRRLARTLAFAAAAGLIFAAMRDGTIEPVVLLAGLTAALAVAMAGRGANGPALEAGVDESGALAIRQVTGADGVPERVFQCAFAAPWLITLRRGTIWVRIWPDSVSRDVFRRIWVHIRWNTGRQPAERTAAIAPGRAR